MNRNPVPFDAFRTSLLPTDRFEDADNAIEQYKDRVPAELVKLWMKDGLRSYGNGIFTFVDPTDYEQLFTSFNPDNQEHIVFARSAFADLYSIKGESVYCTLVYYSSCVLTSPYFDHFGFSSLRDSDFVRDALYKTSFDEACNRLGEPEYDECFGYSPMPILGGSGSPDTLKRVNALIYLDIMSQASIQIGTDSPPS